MPVNVLLCEGVASSPDIRLLRTILRGSNLQIKPAGSKYGMGDEIKLRQELMGTDEVAGILDRDFDGDLSIPTQQPRRWQGKDNNKTIRFGWRWERKEVENYLLDPLVVKQALEAKAPPSYDDILQQAVKTLTDYTAARIALSISRTRRIPISSSWGKEHGKGEHKFPDALTEIDCRQSIKDIVTTYVSEQIIKPDDVLQKFEEYLPHCRVSGIYFNHFLSFFAGKDLLYAMEPDLKKTGFQSAKAFRSSILNSMEETQANVWEWMPEWTALRTAVLNYPND